MQETLHSSNGRSPRTRSVAALQRPLVAQVLEAVRLCPGHRKSYRRQNLLKGRVGALRALDDLINDEMSDGATEEQVLAIGEVIVACIRHKFAMLRKARGEKETLSLDELHELETAMQGLADRAQWGTRTRSPGDLNRCWHDLSVHAGVLDRLRRAVKADFLMLTFPTTA